MTNKEFKRLAQKIAALMGEHPDSMVGVLLLTTIVNDLERAGWKFVPVCVTSKMLRAGREAENHPLFIYEAMLAAAPKVTE